MSKFVDIKLRLLKEHEAVVNDKDTMYTTKVRKMQAIIDQLTEDLANERELTERLNSEKISSQLHAAEEHIKRMMMRGGGVSLLNVVRSWAKYTKDKKGEVRTNEWTDDRKNERVDYLVTQDRFSTFRFAPH